MRKMSSGQSGSYAENGFRRSSRGSIWRERRQKRHEDREYEQKEEQSSLGEGLYQTHQMISGTSRRERFDGRDEELKHLRRLVRDLELEARDRCQRRDRDECKEELVSVRGRYGEGSYRSGPHRHRDQSREYVDLDLISPEERWLQNASIDAMS